MGLFSKYKLKHKVEGDLLRVVYSGKLTKIEMDEIMNKIYKLIRENKINKLLIDATESDLKLELNESLAMANSQPPELRSVKTAVIEKKSKADQYKMFEMFVENRNYDMHFFNNLAEAEKWLFQKNA